MANVLHRTTKEYVASVNTPDYPTVDWIINPDLSAVVGFASKYWTITGDVVTLQTPAERAVTDAAELAQLKIDAQSAAKAPIAESNEGEGIRLRGLIELINKRDNYIVNRIIELQDRVQAMLDSTGNVANMRVDGLAVSISATTTRTRADAIQDYRDSIDAGDVDAGE